MFMSNECVDVWLALPKIAENLFFLNNLQTSFEFIRVCYVHKIDIVIEECDGSRFNLNSCSLVYSSSRDI